MINRKPKKAPATPGDDRAKRFSRPWYESQPKRARQWFENIAWALFFLVLVFAITLLVDEGDLSYYKAHGTLFALSIGVVLLLFIRRSDAGQMLGNSRRALSFDKSAGLDEFGDALFVAALIIVAMSILFIIDLSFFSNYGLRIGAVAAIALFTLFRTAIRSLRQ